MSKVMRAIEDFLLESEVEYFSVADSKLKEYVAEFLPSLMKNTSLKTLDIRGNLMGDTGVRELTRIIQTNRHLHTIYYDRNFLSLNNFEDLVIAMEENYVIEYLPVPITDIILMKITEKDRMEKLQYLMNKLDTLCTRNQNRKAMSSSLDTVHVATTANLTREITASCDNQQQLLGDQTSLEYILSCSNRNTAKTDEIPSILNRTARIAKISSQIYDLYRIEEDQLLDEWKNLCEKFEEKIQEKNQRLSRRFYQLFKEQSSIHYDDKFQEQIRNYFTDSTDHLHEYLNKEVPSRLTTYTRECYINIATSLQRRAYDTTNDIAIDMHKQLEAAMFQIPTPSISDNQQYVSTLDRLVKSGANVVHRIAHKHHPTPPDADDSKSNLKPSDSTEQLNVSPKPSRSVLKPTLSKPSTSPRPPAPPPVGWRRSVLNPTTDPEEDEGDLIAHEILDIVEQEQLKDQQKTLEEHNLDIDIDQTNKLNHLAKSRPRPANRQPRARRPTNGGGGGASHDSSSDGGLDNDETSVVENPSSQTAELPPKNATKPVKPTLKSDVSSTPPPVPLKTQLQSRISTAQHPITSPVARTNSMSKPKITALSDPPSIINSDVASDVGQSKNFMSLSSYATLSTTNKDEQKEKASSSENLTSPTPPPPPVSSRTGKIAVGPRVLPALDPNSDPPAVKLRPLPSERKPPPTESESGADANLTDDNEQYKRLSVKERARMLTTPNSTTDKKASSPLNPTGVNNEKNSL